MFRTKNTPGRVLPSFSNFPELTKLALIAAIVLLIFQLLTDGLFLVTNQISKTYQVDVFYWAARLLISAAALWLSVWGISRTTILLFVFSVYILGNSLLGARGLPDEAFDVFTEILPADWPVSSSISIAIFICINIFLFYCHWSSLKLVDSK